MKDESGRQICTFKDIPGRRISAGGQIWKTTFFCLPGSLEDKSGRQIFETTLLPRIQLEDKKIVCQGFRNNWASVLSYSLGMCTYTSAGSVASSLIASVEVQ